MVDLVEVIKNEIYCDSSLLAKKFGFKHGYVVKHIENIKEDLSNMEGVRMFTPKIHSEIKEYRGQKYTVYLMNRDFFSTLVMRFKGKKAFRWQALFIAAFNEMENRLLKLETNPSDQQWIGQREQSKVARREETDIIKEFVGYATKQGSKSAKFYYKHITNATYKALGLIVQRKPKLRDTMDIYEISELMLAERVAKNSIKKYMELGRNYKDVYDSVKDDLIAFSNGLRITENKQLS